MKTIRLQNVKAFADTGDIQIAPITLFVGQNSCGKSSLIRFPVVLSQTIKQGSVLCLHSRYDDAIDYGSFEDVLHNGEGDSFIVSLGYDVKYENVDEYSTDERGETWVSEDYGRILNMQAEIKYKKDAETSEVYISDYTVFVDGIRFCAFRHDFENDVCHFSQYKDIYRGKLIDTEYHMILGNHGRIHIFPRLMSDEVNDIQAICKSCLYIEPDLFDTTVDYLFKEYGYVGDGTFNTLDSTLMSLGNIGGSYPLKEEEREKYLKTSPSQSTLFGPSHFTAWQYTRFLRIWHAYSVADMLIDELSSHIRNDFWTVHYIGPFRLNPERIYRMEGTHRRYVGKNGENTSDILINNSIKDNSVLQKVSTWLETAFHYSINAVSLGNDYYQIQLKDERSKASSNIMDVGYGISQVLPIVTQIAESLVFDEHNPKLKEDEWEPANYMLLDRSEMYVIEQPELHLHPAAQSQLASLFATLLNSDSIQKRYMLIETHSEHLIRALQVLIADPDCFLTSDMVKIYYIDRDENGDSSVNEMKMNEYGQFIAKWPKGFFDEAHVMSKKLMDMVANRKYGTE